MTLHADHVKAVANGGGDDISNLVTSCSDCNYGKGTKILRHKPTTGTSAARHGGLIGFYGHRLDENGHVNNQFMILGMACEGTCIVQLYSFMDGSPTEVEMVQTEDLSGPSYRLYATEVAWKMGYWEDRERRGFLRKTAAEALETDLWFSRIMRGERA